MCRLVPAVLFALLVVSFTQPVQAGCQTLAFSVNDYGKEGPTRDAKRLLDEYIKSWTAERGIKNYKVGEKTVSCKLFIDLILFDEHTCKASAKFCWKS